VTGGMFGGAEAAPAPADEAGFDDAGGDLDMDF